MKTADKLTAFQNRFYSRIRHPDARRAAKSSGSEDGFDAFHGHKYCLLVTFRRSGEPVPTPVWFGLADGKLYVLSEVSAGKVKRIRNDSHVRVAPCSVRGKPLGSTVEGTAQILPPSEAPRAEAAIGANYGLGRRLYEGAGSKMGINTIYLEISPSRGSS